MMTNARFDGQACYIPSVLDILSAVSTTFRSNDVNPASMILRRGCLVDL